jgi:thiosulfate reductase cytochrome b subunit
MRIQVAFMVALLAALLLCLEPRPVEAGGRIPTIRYRGGAQGRVVFDHQLHASKGFRCNDCHTDFARTGEPLFFTRKQGLFTFADHQTATKCFACHDGKGAFDECARCHRNVGGS